LITWLTGADANQSATADATVFVIWRMNDIIELDFKLHEVTLERDE
jgi:hypothetical protein